jgi:hypothetical protein
MSVKDIAKLGKLLAKFVFFTVRRLATAALVAPGWPDDAGEM